MWREEERKKGGAARPGGNLPVGAGRSVGGICDEGVVGHVQPVPLRVLPHHAPQRPPDRQLCGSEENRIRMKMSLVTIAV